MANRDAEALLPASVLRNIGDKMYEKRKIAALEVEQIIKKLASSGARDKVNVLLKKLVNDFALSSQANHRKGGLLCLAAATVALKRFYDRLKFNYLEQIVEPVSFSLNDQDSRVRYYACEALYNIAKAMREEFVANQDLFLKVFTELFNLYGDTDSNVQNAAQHLDDVMKDIVLSSPTFDIENLMICLETNLMAENVHKRQFLIGWIDALGNDPSLNVLPFLPKILPGLMSMLNDEYPEIRQLATKALNNFLDDLTNWAGEPSVDYAAVMEVLLEKCETTEDTTTCLMALNWLENILKITLDEVLGIYGPLVGAVLKCISHQNTDVQRAALSVNQALRLSKTPDAWMSVDLRDLLSNINNELSSSEEPTRVEAIRWLEFLLEQCPNAVLDDCKSIVNAVLEALNSHWDRVVKSGIRLLALLAQQQTQFRFVMEALLQGFQGREGLKLLHSSGAFVIQQLAMQLGAKEVYGELATALQAEKFGPEFSSTIVQALNVLLVTSPELISLPRLLRKGLKDPEAKEFFLILYPAWSRSVCAVLTICFLVQAYDFAWKLILDFGNSLYGASADAMVQIVRLVKLIEAPAFGFLRLELLQQQKSPFLVSTATAAGGECLRRNPCLLKSLRGLLMLLPQTDAFHTLVDRLKSLPSCSYPQPQNETLPDSSTDLDEAKLLKIFEGSCSCHTTLSAAPPTQTSSFYFTPPPPPPLNGTFNSDPYLHHTSSS